ncbi:MAG TPA: BT_3928 family protein [Bacteroidales bacterium]|nr:BT_3928 family protein [Bacteroidales bacterium]
MKTLNLVARIVVGLTFVFSGTVKAIDPLGSAYKFNDYFHAFNLGFLTSLALPLAIFLCTAEFIAGFCVLTGVMKKAGIKLVLLLMIIFTPLTLVLAIFNPVSDCGCFGDAIKMTNWQTFLKNIVLLLFTIILVLNLRKNKDNAIGNHDIKIVVVVSVLFVLFSIYNLIYLPVIDFLPYKEGVRIADKMKIPEGAEPDKYETTFIYEKNGTRKEFDINNYPADDTSWKFVDQKSILVSKGYQPPIHDFSITNSKGEDITDSILTNKGSTVLMIVKKFADAREKHLVDGFDFGRTCLNNGIDFYVLTASGLDEATSYDNTIKFCNADETTLKTIVRSNPGYMLIENGIIRRKWSWAEKRENAMTLSLNRK